MAMSWQASIAPPAACPGAAARDCRHRRRHRCRLPQPPRKLLSAAGLDKNAYDKKKCQAEFDAYKECKKQQVGRGEGGAELLAVNVRCDTHSATTCPPAV